MNLLVGIPLVGFGNIANFVEAKCNHPQYAKSRVLGTIACLSIVLPLPIMFFIFGNYILGTSTLDTSTLDTSSLDTSTLGNTPLFWLLETFILYLAIGQRSLAQHAQQIFQPLQHHDLATARHFTGYIVSRDTQDMSQQDMTRATVESVLENGHDAVIASLFYFCLGGAPLVILHRLVNTLDAMCGLAKPLAFCTLVGALQG